MSGFCGGGGKNPKFLEARRKRYKMFEDDMTLTLLRLGGGELLSRSKNEAYLTWPKDTLKVGK